jgi:crotonobetainyl-CoA:carnitine CoA-transferase CaiB-like acyl-CoA transferase
MADHNANERSDTPLAGLVVADFSRVLAGPLTTMMLGDLGAEIIKIERPGSGDETRAWGPPYSADGDSAYYLSVNRNKRSIALDLGDDAQRDQARAIAESADILIENFRAGTMQRYGLDYDSLRSRNPGLVYCRISGFGNQKGRDLPGYDFLAQALSGLMSITGDPDGPPMKTGVAIVDVLTGLHATIGILAAIHDRQRTQSGQMVEVNLFSSALASLVNQASSYLTTGTVPVRISNQHPSIAPYETFATASAPIVIAVGNDGQFHKLCRALGAEQIASNPLWASNAKRVSNRDELKTALEEILTSHPHDHWLRLLEDAGIPCGPVNNIAEAFEMADRLRLDAVRELTRVSGATVATVSNPISFSRSAVRYELAPPKLGGDSAEILEWLQKNAKG